MEDTSNGATTVDAEAAPTTVHQKDVIPGWLMGVIANHTAVKGLGLCHREVAQATIDGLYQRVTRAAKKGNPVYTPSSPRFWDATHFAIRDVVRRIRRIRAREVLTDMDRVVTDEAERTEDATSDRVDARALLNQLSLEESVLVAARCLQGKTGSEVAKEHGVSRETITRRWGRLSEHLNDLRSDDDDDEADRLDD